MKTILFYILSLLSILDVNSQITLLKDFSQTGKSIYTNYCYLTDTTGVYVSYDYANTGKNIYLYDDNLTLRTINSGSDSIQSIIASKYLFNSDDKIEFLVYSFQNGKSSTYVITEDGTLLYTFLGAYTYVYNTATGPKLKLTGTGIDKWYALPGKIYPTNKGAKGDKGDPGMSYTTTKSIIGNSYLLSDPTPNPTIDNTTIGYNLGMTNTRSSYLVFYDLKGVKRLSVLMDANQDHIDVTKSILGTGTFIYRIENDNNISAGKKLIIE